MGQKSNLERLQEAGFEIAPECPTEYMQVIDELGEEEIKTLIYVKLLLDQRERSISGLRPYRECFVPF